MRRPDATHRELSEKDASLGAFGRRRGEIRETEEWGEREEKRKKKECNCREKKKRDEGRRVKGDEEREGEAMILWRSPEQKRWMLLQQPMKESAV